MKTILIQIASYRDWELVNTIESALSQAQSPERLRFAIVTQDEPSNFNILEKYLGDSRFKIEFQHWRDARGVGLARRITDDMYNGEDFFFQIDAHMRFTESWDDALVSEWSMINDERAVLSSYPPAYKYGDNGKEEYVASNPNRLVVHDMFMGTIPVFFGQEIPNPVIGSRGAFVAGGMQFGPGRICHDVPYNKDICFIGEEIVHSLRLYEAKYNVYTPINQVVYHLYLRSKNQNNAYHFWNDFLEDQSLSHIYKDMNDKSYATVKLFLGGKADIDPQVVRDFENFAGVDFSTYTVHPDTYLVPPLPMSVDDSWRSSSFPPKKQN